MQGNNRIIFVDGEKPIINKVFYSKDVLTRYDLKLTLTSDNLYVYCNGVMDIDKSDKNLDEDTGVIYDQEYDGDSSIKRLSYFSEIVGVPVSGLEDIFYDITRNFSRLSSLSDLLSKIGPLNELDNDSLFGIRDILYPKLDYRGSLKDKEMKNFIDYLDKEGIIFDHNHIFDIGSSFIEDSYGDRFHGKDNLFFVNANPEDRYDEVFMGITMNKINSLSSQLKRYSAVPAVRRVQQGD